MKNIRNFCIIAHIDHGKSTLADRFLEVTGTVERRDMKAQLLDSMDLERERGITIKLQPVRMDWKSGDGSEYALNLIDTPGHVDFNYEVSRSLAAVEGAILLVDASQGVQAQTIGNLYLALEQDLEIIPVMNKIDLPAADPDRTREEICHLLGCRPEEVLAVSGKTGEGVTAVLEEVIRRVPPPSGDPERPLRALVFDSQYDDYKGVVAMVRVVDGKIVRGQRLRLLATASESDNLEIGFYRPRMAAASGLTAGEIGYVVTGLKQIDSCRVGDTLAVAGNSGDPVSPLPGYKEVVPMVFAGIFPREGDEFDRLRQAMLKLKLSDSSLTFEPERQQALGFGFRCGLLGLLHLEIVQERLRREHDMDIVVTVPSVAYNILKTNGETLTIKSPLELPDPTHVRQIDEPWVRADIICPRRHIGAVMGLVQEKRGLYRDTEYLTVSGAAAGQGKDSDRAILHYEMPLSAILVDFYDKLKGVTSGYASLNYEFVDYRRADVVRLDIMVADDPVEALATIAYRDEAERVGRRICRVLRDSLPRQQFQIKIQAAIGGKIVASE
ncbi:elongation factor 4, partial [Candidatus Uhrbacteria bacterium]|nr:elongation factor 4 [Candidatus Uhrbacteria bacterium]